MSTQIRGLTKRTHVDGEYVWYIDKRVKRYGRLCESTGTADREEAERYLLHRLKELREVLVYGERPTRTFEQAAARYVSDFAHKKSIGRDAATLKDMEPFIGRLALDRINDVIRSGSGSRHRRVSGISGCTTCIPSVVDSEQPG